MDESGVRFWLREFSHGFVWELRYCSTGSGGVVSIVEQSLLFDLIAQQRVLVNRP